MYLYCWKSPPNLTGFHDGSTARESPYLPSSTGCLTQGASLSSECKDVQRAFLALRQDSFVVNLVGMKSHSKNLKRDPTGSHSWTRHVYHSPNTYHSPHVTWSPMLLAHVSFPKQCLHVRGSYLSCNRISPQSQNFGLSSARSLDLPRLA